MSLESLLDGYKKNTPDISEHLDTLTGLAEQCEHITEFGFRHGASFCAFLLGRPKFLVTYDININPAHTDLFGKLREETIIEFNQISTLDTPPVEETDLIFFDTWHTYEQLKQELKIHGNRSKKYLVFHDTETYKDQGQDGSTPGLTAAISEFLAVNPHWRPYVHYFNNNGLTVLRRDDGH